MGGAGEDEVCRFNNPVHFVSRGNEILIVPTEIPEALKKAQFEFVEIDESGIPKKQNARKEVADKGTMRIPEDFDLEKFLDYFMGEFNNKKDIDGLEKCIFKSIGATWIKKGEIQKMSGGKKLV